MTVEAPGRSNGKIAALVSLVIGSCCAILFFAGGTHRSDPEEAMALAMQSLQPLKTQMNRAEIQTAAAGIGALQAQARPRNRAVMAKAMISAVRLAQRYGTQEGCRGNLQCVNAVGLFFGTQGGNTETVAGVIADATGLDAKDIADEEAGNLAGYDGLIVGAPTWHTGADAQRTGTAWDDLFDEIKALDLCGKPVAVFGVGDSAGYGDNFCDAIEELHSTFEAAGAKLLGYTPDSNYEFYSESKSVKGGKFLGLPLDQDNEDDQTEGRVKTWIDQIKGEGMPLA
jgi:flavodoxin I